MEANESEQGTLMMLAVPRFKTLLLSYPINLLKHRLHFRGRSCYAFPALLFSGLLVWIILGHVDLITRFMNIKSRSWMQRYRNCDVKRRLPGCIIIGTPKSGTKALIEFIGAHPDVEIAQGEAKFFNRNDNYYKGYQHYLKKMPLSCSDQITLEKSPEYFYSRVAPYRIHKMNHSIKLIIIVKDPVQRAISDYIHRRTTFSGRKETNYTFEELAYDNSTKKLRTQYLPVIRSIYYRYMLNWLTYFSPSQIHVADGNNLIVEPQDELSKVQDFLGLERLITKDSFVYNSTKGYYCLWTHSSTQCLAPCKGHKNHSVSPELVNKLNLYFKPYNELFFNIINKRLSWT